MSEFTEKRIRAMVRRESPAQVRPVVWDELLATWIALPIGVQADVLVQVLHDLAPAAPGPAERAMLAIVGTAARGRHVPQRRAARYVRWAYRRYFRWQESPDAETDPARASRAHRLHAVAECMIAIVPILEHDLGDRPGRWSRSRAESLHQGFLAAHFSAHLVCVESVLAQYRGLVACHISRRLDADTRE
jgi:hypothetical protein